MKFAFGMLVGVGLTCLGAASQYQYNEKVKADNERLKKMVDRLMAPPVPGTAEWLRSEHPTSR